MKIQTSRFGNLEVSKDVFLDFPSGLVGFPAVRQFVVLDTEQDSAYQWFQSVDEPTMAFVIVDVDLLDSDLRVEVPDEGLVEIEYAETDPLLIMAVITIPSGKPDEATANLRAPLVVNLRTRKGKQVILHESIPLRVPLAQANIVPASDHEVTPEPASV